MSAQLGDNLRELREFTTEFSQSQIAELLHIDRSTYTNYELGKTDPPIPTILRLCKIFNVTCDELINPESIKRRSN